MTVAGNPYAGFDFQVTLHPYPAHPRNGGEPRYVVSIRHVGGIRDPSLRTHVELEDFPYTEEGYMRADRLAQRLVLAVEEQTMPFFTGSPKNGLRVDYYRNERTHEEAVE